jgi:Tfp pilus assembly protein PilF
MASNGAAAVERAIEHHKAGRFDQAVVEYKAALAAEPGNAEAGHYFGVLLLQAGRGSEAIECLARAVAARPDWVEARNNYGVALREQGRIAEAAEQFQAAVSMRPDLFDANNNLADVLLVLGNINGARGAAEAAHRANPRQVEPLLTLATIHLLRRDPIAAMEPIHRAREINPNHERAVALYRTAISRIVQPWHFPMMNDPARNDAYEAAIKRAVTPESMVLDIGTGAGLLSMMAARAGARRVVTCEMTVPVAAKARQIVAQNGFAERVTVHAKRSNDLAVGAELPERADVLVSEIFDSDLLSEGVLPSLEDAHARLVKPGARIIPQSASVMVALAGGDKLAEMVHVNRASGFDIFAFNEFMPERFIFDGARFKFDMLSAPLAALSFDFRETRYPRSERVMEARVTRRGLCLGVVQWLKVELDEQTTFENPPTAKGEITSGWLHSLYTFAPPVQVETGQTLRFVAGHTREFPYFRLVDVR